MMTKTRSTATIVLFIWIVVVLVTAPVPFSQDMSCQFCSRPQQPQRRPAHFNTNTNNITYYLQLTAEENDEDEEEEKEALSLMQDVGEELVDGKALSLSQQHMRRPSGVALQEAQKKGEEKATTRGLLKRGGGSSVFQQGSSRTNAFIGSSYVLYKTWDAEAADFQGQNTISENAVSAATTTTSSGGGAGDDPATFLQRVKSGRLIPLSYLMNRYPHLNVHTTTSTSSSYYNGNNQTTTTSLSKPAVLTTTTPPVTAATSNTHNVGPYTITMNNNNNNNNNNNRIRITSTTTHNNNNNQRIVIRQQPQPPKRRPGGMTPQGRPLINLTSDLQHAPLEVDDSGDVVVLDSSRLGSSPIALGRWDTSSSSDHKAWSTVHTAATATTTAGRRRPGPSVRQPQQQQPRVTINVPVGGAGGTPTRISGNGDTVYVQSGGMTTTIRNPGGTSHPGVGGGGMTINLSSGPGGAGGNVMINSVPPPPINDGSILGYSLSGPGNNNNNNNVQKMNPMPAHHHLPTQQPQPQQQARQTTRAQNNNSKNNNNNVRVTGVTAGRSESYVNEAAIRMIQLNEGRKEVQKRLTIATTKLQAGEVATKDIETAQELITHYQTELKRLNHEFEQAKAAVQAQKQQ